MSRAAVSRGHVLFLCTGNTCRSPLAAAVAHDAGVLATSAGLDAKLGAPATAEARAVAEQAGLDVRAHVSRAATEPVVAAAGTIYTMTAAQAEEASRRWPQHATRIHPLDPDADIADPYGGDEAMYAATFALIERAVRSRLSENP